jgi:hypothetical protein
VQAAFGWEAVSSCPFGCMGLVAEKDMVAVHLGESCLVHTYWCYCTAEVLAIVLADTDPLAHQGRMALEQLALEQQYAPGLELLELAQPVLVAYSMLQLAAAVACLGQVID